MTFAASQTLHFGLMLAAAFDLGMQVVAGGALGELRATYTATILSELRAKHGDYAAQTEQRRTVRRQL